MRIFRLLTACLIFLLHTSYVSAQTVRTCCADLDCPITQCMASGCATQQVPVTVALSVHADLVAIPLALPRELPFYLPTVDEEIWTPPD